MRLTQTAAETGEHWVTSGPLNDLGIWTTCLNGKYRIRTGLPGQSLLLQFNIVARETRRIGSTSLAGDDIVVGLPGCELDGLIAGQHQGMSLVIPDALAMEALTLRAPEAVKQLRSRTCYIISGCGTHVTALRRIAGHIIGSGGKPLVLRVPADSIIDIILDTMIEPWHRNGEAAVRLPRLERLTIVRRVEEFMRDNLGRRMMLHEICRTAQTSQRAVEYAFSSVCGVGPKQYLKLLRLNEARRRLKSHAPGLTSVVLVARELGFWHMGHFTADYRHLFGETPNQTRR